LILTHSFLGEKDAVDRLQSELAKEIATDALDGPSIETVLAVARGRLGEAEVAIAAVKQLLEKPGETSLTPAMLRIDPHWDPLRSDPRFQELANGKP
jgi:hypothetical protein